MARTDAIHKQQFSRTKLLTALSLFFFATPCDVQAGAGDPVPPSLELTLSIEGSPDEFIGEIKSEDFAEAARKDWDAMSKALDKSSKEDFDKSVAEVKNLEDAADGRYKLRLHEWEDYREKHIDAVKRLEKGKISDDDVDVLKRYRELEASKNQARTELSKISKLKEFAEFSWTEWTEFWEAKKAWEKKHPGKNALAGHGNDWLMSNLVKEKVEKPTQTETKKTKSVKRRSTTKKEEAAADTDGAEIAAGIGTVLLGTQMGGHHGRSRREHGNGHSNGMKQTTSSRKTTTRSSTTKSGAASGGSGATMNTTVGAPTITFGRGF